MTDWGSSLSDRKLAPHEDVQFDIALKPRAHHMVGRLRHLFLVVKS